MIVEKSALGRLEDVHESKGGWREKSDHFFFLVVAKLRGGIGSRRRREQVQ